MSRISEALFEENWIYMNDTVSKKYRLIMTPFSMMSASVRSDEMAKIANSVPSKLHKKLGDSLYPGIDIL